MIIYKTINLINNKIYIGQDSNNNPKYLGSGLLLRKAINKYGKKNFKKEILEFCNNQNELNEKEIYWIEKMNSRDLDIGYNIDYGGKSSKKTIESIKKTAIGNTGKKRTIEQKDKLSKSANKRWEDTTNRDINSLKQKEVWSKLSQEEKNFINDKRSKTMIDVCKDPEYKERHSNILKEYYKNNHDKLLKAQKIAWKNKEKIYKILTPDNEILEIQTRKSVMEYLQCSYNFFKTKKFKGYKLLESYKPINT